MQKVSVYLCLPRWHTDTNENRNGVKKKKRQRDELERMKMLIGGKTFCSFLVSSHQFNLIFCIYGALKGKRNTAPSIVQSLWKFVKTTANFGPFTCNSRHNLEKKCESHTGT